MFSFFIERFVFFADIFSKLNWEGWFVVVVFICTFTALIKEIMSPDIILAIGAGLFVMAGIITPQQFLRGFSQDIVVTIAMLCIIVRTIELNGILHLVGSHLFPKEKKDWINYLSLFVPVSIMSAFLNNTPIVLMMTPMIRKWALEQKKNPSKYLIPLSYAAILGGMCTLIGTSTNLIVDGLLRAHHPNVFFKFFELGKVGIFVVIAGLLYLTFIGRYILPNRQDPTLRMAEETQKFTVEMLVEEDSPFIQKKIEEIKELQDRKLIEIQRSYRTIDSPGPEDVILAGDRLVFVGDISEIADIHGITGLKSTIDPHFSIKPNSSHFSEVVIAPRSSLIGKTLKKLKFRERFDASVLAVYRQGKRMTANISDIVLQPGDTLMLLSSEPWRGYERFRSDFFIIRHDEKVLTYSFWYSLFLIGVMAAMVIAASFFGVQILVASMGAAFIYIITKSISVREVHRSISWDVLILIGSAFGFGLGLEVTGVAKTFATIFLSFTGKNPYFLTAAIFLLTAILTELITNNAAVIILFPIALEAATLAGYSGLSAVKSIGVILAIAASSSFLTPISYQTNTIVYGPGGYHFTDYLKVGILLKILVFIIAMIVIPIVWPLGG